MTDADDLVAAGVAMRRRERRHEGRLPALARQDAGLAYPDVARPRFLGRARGAVDFVADRWPRRIAAVMAPRAAPAQALAALSQRLSNGFFFIQGLAMHELRALFVNADGGAMFQAPGARAGSGRARLATLNAAPDRAAEWPWRFIRPHQPSRHDASSAHPSGLRQRFLRRGDFRESRLDVPDG